MSGAFEPLASSAQRPAASPNSVFFVGDSITLGWRDEGVGGWPVRLVAGLNAGQAVTAYNLGVRGDTSQQILVRWQDEVQRRRRPLTSDLIVFAFGANDAKLDAAGRPLIPVAAIRENTRSILQAATSNHHVLFIGPAPVDEGTLARTINISGDVPIPTNRQIVAVSGVLEGVAAATGVPYLDLMQQLSNDELWFEAIRGTDGIHPPSRGHDMIAAHVASWAPWTSLFA